MELYLLKSAAILAILFFFYKLVLENTSIHTFKRIYLFGILLVSFLIPFITFTSYVEVSPVFYTYTEGTPQIAIPEAVESINYWPFVLWTIYGLGVLFFSVKFFRNLFIIIQQIRTNPKYRNSGFINILLNEVVIPHTFFSYIFLNKKQFEKGEIPSEVILHEQTHAIQKHSLDVIFVELLQIVFWFNPLFYFLKKSIKLNHEFLADRAVLNTGAETSEYQKILLAFSSNAFTPALAHSINYSSIKKRFTVMKTHTSKRAIWLRSLLILPLLSVLIYGFSIKEVVAKQSENQVATSTETIEDIIIVIDKNSQITINAIPVAFTDIKSEINKKNTHLTIEQKQKYLSANVGFYNEKDKDLAEKVTEIFYANNLRNFSIYNLKNMEDANLDTTIMVNSFSGKTVEEAEVLYQNSLKEIEKFKNERQNANNDENNPWSVQVGDPVERDETTGKIIQQKATKAEIVEYNKLAKKYNALAIEKRIIPLTDLKVLETIYKKMTDEQKANAEPFPECIPSASATTPSPSVNNGGSTVIISRSKETGFHFNTQPSTVSTLYYYEGNLIPFSKVHKLMNENINLKMYITEESFGHAIATLSEKPILGFKESLSVESKAPAAENGNLYMAAEAPPAPNPNKIEYIKELAKRGAIFYIGPHKYSTDEAIKMAEKSTNDVTIDVSKYPVVYLGGC